MSPKSYFVEVTLEEFEFLEEPLGELEGVAAVLGQGGDGVHLLSQLQEAWVPLQLVPKVPHRCVDVAQVLVDVAYHRHRFRDTAGVKRRCCG